MNVRSKSPDVVVEFDEVIGADATEQFSFVFHDIVQECIFLLLDLDLCFFPLHNLSMLLPDSLVLLFGQFARMDKLLRK